MAKKAKMAVPALPLLLVMLLLGWCLIYFGSKKSREKIRHDVKVKKRFEVEMGVLQPEEHQVSMP